MRATDFIQTMTGLQPILAGSTVKYLGGYMFYLGSNSSGFARLMMADGVIYSGTPSPRKLEVVKQDYTRYAYHGLLYVDTKIGMISLKTGKVVSDRFAMDVRRLGSVYDLLAEWSSEIADVQQRMDALTKKLEEWPVSPTYQEWVEKKQSA